MRKIIFALLITTTLASLSVWAESDYVYIRKLEGKGVSAQEEVRFLQNNQAKPRTELIDGLRQQQWDDNVLWVEIVTQNDQHRLRILKRVAEGLAAPFPANGKIVFSRRVGSYFDHDLRNIIDIRFQDNHTLDEVVTLAKERIWLPEVRSVEAIDLERGGIVLRLTCLAGQNMVEAERQFLWVENAMKQWAIGHNTENFIYDGCPSGGGFAFFTEVFRGEGLQNVSVTHRNLLEPGPQGDQGLFSLVLPAKSLRCRGLKLEQAAPGRVLFAEFSKPENKKTVSRNIMWRAASDHIIDIYYRTEDFEKIQEIVAIYAKAFPSTIPETLKIDKTEWGRTEMTVRLEKMHEILNKSPVDMDRLEVVFGKLDSAVQLPIKKLGKTEQERRSAVLALDEWWKANKDNTEWDEEHAILVVKGVGVKSPLKQE